MTTPEAMEKIGDIVATLATSNAMQTEQLRAVKDELLQVCVMQEWLEDPTKTYSQLCSLTIKCGRNSEIEHATEFITRRRREAIEKGRGL
jgi:hypothetical protein